RSMAGVYRSDVSGTELILSLQGRQRQCLRRDTVPSAALGARYRSSQTFGSPPPGYASSPLMCGSNPLTRWAPPARSVAPARGDARRLVRDQLGQALVDLRALGGVHGDLALFQQLVGRRVRIGAGELVGPALGVEVAVVRVVRIDLREEVGVRVR